MSRQLQDLVKAQAKIALNVRGEEVLDLAHDLFDLLADAEVRIRRHRLLRSQQTEWEAILDQMSDLGAQLQAVTRRDRGLPPLGRPSAPS